jgi:ATP-dependent Clp protease adaptor protein ClpS
MGSSLNYATRRKIRLKEPGAYQVVLLNDDVTTMDFVVEVLMAVFNKTEREAERIMLAVHETGRGVAGVYSLDVARTKEAEVRKRSKENGFPLKCVIEHA